MDNFCGKRLDGRYEIREIIGVGGMAVVYKAYDNIDDRIVAIKILKDEFLTNEELKRRFKNESKAIAVLSHPNIVRVYNVSFGDRLQYIVMEYVDGITLKEYIEQQGVVNWKEAVHFAGQILAALQHAHDKGIVHQDIKPQNIMLLQDGTIKVTDFGIARFSRADGNTKTDNAIGSVHYISPEQARGQRTDDKADIYSVGVVMYEMLTGQLPFQSDSAVSVALMQLQQDPIRPRELLPTLPLGLEQITIRAMQKNPSERYHSAAEMLMDINDFKRNPAIKFNYSYFVDKEPTKYIKTSEIIEKADMDDEEVEIEEKKSVNRTTAVMIGAFAGVAVIAIIIALVLGIMGNQKIPVDNFVSKNFKDVYGNAEYTDFKLEYVFKEELLEHHELGTITAQSIEASSKVKKGTKITLTVAGTEEDVMETLKDTSVFILSSDVIGMKEADAIAYLKEKYGVQVESVDKYNEEYEVGMVFATDPDVNATVKAGDTVTIFVATDVKEQVKVIDFLIFETEERIEEQIKKYGLKAEFEIVPSDKPTGTIFEQSVPAETYIDSGSTITFKVSDGSLCEREASITVKMPNNGTASSGPIQVFLDGKLYKEETVLLNGSDYVFKVNGVGVMSYKIIYVGGNSVLQEGTIDFSQETPVISEKMAVLPNVVDYTIDEAKLMLAEAGFVNVVISYENSDIPKGKVIAQSPTDTGVEHKTTETIYITVSDGPAV